MKENNNVIWKDIKDYEGLYKVNNKGEIKNRFNKIIKSYNKHGKKKYNPLNDYQILHLYKKSKRKTCKVHRLVAEAFIPNINNLPQINHKNGIKNDNRVENLEWCTNKQNAEHYHRFLKKEQENGNNK